jgi:hypothetical protein
MVILIMYVDDLIITGNNDDHIAQVKKELHAGFKMTDLGLLHYYLGIEVFQHPHHIFISQSKYAVKILQWFGMQDCKPSLTLMEQHLKLSKFEGGGMVDNTIYRQLIGSLIYLTNTQPDLSYAINILSRFMQQPQDNHWNSPKEFFDISKEQKILVFFTKRLKILYLVDFQMSTLLEVLMIEHQHQVI